MISSSLEKLRKKTTDYPMNNTTKENLRTKDDYHLMVETTIKELYPAEKYPKNLFPDIHLLLFNLFLEAAKTRRDLPELYRQYKKTAAPGSKKKQKWAAAGEEILGFKNLLINHPRTVVMMYRKYIERFIFYKHGSQDEREDVFQEVITRLIEDKIYKIREKYDFKTKNFSTFTSYLLVTVRNIYIDIIRERNIRPLTAGELEPADNLFDGDKNGDMMNKLLIDEELLKLRTIIKMYYRIRPKLELCLKLKYRIPVEKDDTRSCFPNCSRTDEETLTRDFKRVKDKTMFENVVGVFNLHEGRHSQSDTIRKWVFVKIDEIVSHLNRTHNAVVYNRKNVGELVLLYYQGRAAAVPVRTRAHTGSAYTGG